MAKKKIVLSREQMLNGGGPKLKTQEVDLSIGTVLIRQWTGHEQQDIMDLQKKYKQPMMFNCAVITRSVVNENGEFAFSGSTEEIEALMNWTSADLLKITNACLDINGMSSQTSGELEKNF